MLPETYCEAIVAPPELWTCQLCSPAQRSRSWTKLTDAPVAVPARVTVARPAVVRANRMILFLSNLDRPGRCCRLYSLVAQPPRVAIDMGACTLTDGGLISTQHAHFRSRRPGTPAITNDSRGSFSRSHLHFQSAPPMRRILHQALCRSSTTSSMQFLGVFSKFLEPISWRNRLHRSNLWDGSRAGETDGTRKSANQDKEEG